MSQRSPLPPASHGKYFSHSDVDRRYINPLTNPPNLSLYSAWNCTRSTDLIIQQACQRLINEYQSGMASQMIWMIICCQKISMLLTVFALLHNDGSVIRGLSNSAKQYFSQQNPL